jgi:drug/metabolite transporter (DMT)-like permease
VAATLGQVCITRAFTAGNPGRVAVVGLSQVVFALGLDLLFDPRGIAGSMLVGIAFILVPTAWMMANRTPAAPPAEEPRALAPEPETVSAR